MTLEIKESQAFIVEGNAFATKEEAEKFITEQTLAGQISFYLYSLKGGEFPDRIQATSKRVLGEFLHHLKSNELPKRAKPVKTENVKKK